MTAEQLQAARAAHWRQQQNPILTLDDAARWLEQHPLCLYLPRRAQLRAPAPSFVEATLGTSAATPGTDAIAPAQALLTRLIESGSVVALNLFGAVGEQPDFLVARQALPYVLCLRADADWKHAPEKSSGHKVSPLVLELWKALDIAKGGALTAPEARETLGRELTEAAVLRGLGELWQGLRISPVFGEPGRPAGWELLRVRHRDALTTAGATGQVTALSLLVSIYLQSVYAATGEEIEIFLSPLASRSRVREAVRGLSATRQIHSLSMDSQTYYFLEDGLPEFAPSAMPMAAPTPLPGPLAVSFSAPRRPLSRPGSSKDQGIGPAAASREATRPPSKEWKRPGGAEKSAAARPSFPPTRSFPPAPGASAKTNRGPQRSDGPPRRGARPLAARGRETKPARPEVGREWKKPSWPGKPARPSFPSTRTFPPASAPGGEKTTRGPQRREVPVRSGARPRGERPAPWAGPKPAFRSPQGTRSNRPSGQTRDRRRPDGPVSGPAAGAPAPIGRPAGRRPASFRAKPGPSKTGRPEPGRPGPGRSGPGRSSGQIPRPGYPGSRPPRPSPPRDGDSQPARPPFVPFSRPAKPGQRTGSPSARPSGKPAWKPEGRSSGKPGGKSGGKPGKPPGNFQRRKPTRKKPGA